MIMQAWSDKCGSAVMDETGYFLSGANQLFYRFKRPVREDRSMGVVFVHAADGNRLGPHRMFVEASKHFRKLGFSTFQFDLAGCGDSEGEQAGSDVSENVFDVENAIRFLRDKYGIEKIVLFGISRGARIASKMFFRDGLGIEGMILLSVPVSGRRAAIKSVSNTIREYIYKLRTAKGVSKLIRGQVNFSKIGQTLMRSAGIYSRYDKNEEQIMVARSPVFFIFAEKDPISEESIRYYSQICRQNRVVHEIHVIPKANHSFFHYKWKEEIFTLCENWLIRLSGGMRYEETD